MSVTVHTAVVRPSYEDHDWRGDLRIAKLADVTESFEDVLIDEAVDVTHLFASALELGVNVPEGTRQTVYLVVEYDPTS